MSIPQRVVAAYLLLIATVTNVLLLAIVTNAADYQCSKNHPEMCTWFNFNSWTADHPHLYQNKVPGRGGPKDNTNPPTDRQKQELITVTTNALKKLNHLTETQQTEAMAQWITLVFDFAWSENDLKSAKGGTYPYGLNVGSSTVPLLDQMSTMGIIHNWNRHGRSTQHEHQNENLDSDSDVYLALARESPPPQGDPAATVGSIQFIVERQMQALMDNVKMGRLIDAGPFWQFFATQARIFADGPSNQGTKFLYIGLIPAYLKVMTAVPADGKSLLNNIYDVLHVCEDVAGVEKCKKGSCFLVLVFCND